MKFRKLKKSARVTLSGYEKVVLWLMWVRGTMKNPRQSYKKSLLEPTTKEDIRTENNLRKFQKRHDIKFFYKNGADIDDFNFQFGKSWSVKK